MDITTGFKTLKEDQFKRKFRWTIEFKNHQGLMNMLPPSKAARPSISFKEIEAVHLTENIYLPGRVEYQPLNVTVYDIGGNLKDNIDAWLKSIYAVDKHRALYSKYYSDTININMLDGSGKVLETWVYEEAWPQKIDFSDLDYSSSDLATIDITFRYSRAYVD